MVLGVTVYAIPATSVLCEQLFSVGTEIITDHLSCLDSERFEQLQILKHSWHLGVIDVA